jgi:hypothetical protein
MQTLANQRRHSCSNEAVRSATKGMQEGCALSFSLSLWSSRNHPLQVLVCFIWCLCFVLEVGTAHIAARWRFWLVGRRLYISILIKDVVTALNESRGASTMR